MKRKIHTSFHGPDLKFIFRLFKKRILKTEAESLPSSRLEVWAVQPTLSLRGLTPHCVATQGRSGIFPGMRGQEGGFCKTEDMPIENSPSLNFTKRYLAYERA